MRASTAPETVSAKRLIFSDVVGDLEFVAFNLNVDGRRQTAVERGAEHPASVEVELGAGKLLRQFFSQLIDIGKSRAPMMLGELDKNERVLRPGVGRVSSRPVEQHAEIRNDDRERQPRSLSRPAPQV